MVALPLAIAFAIASGVPPDKGLVTAIIAGFLISVFGGSRVQIGGPTGAFVVILYSIVQDYGVDGLAMATIIAGVMLLGMGLLRLGSVIKFIPHPLIVGFTSGIALIIFSSQVKDFLGLTMPAPPADFIDKWVSYYHYFNTLNPWALGLGSGSLVLLVLWPRVTVRVPGSLIVLILATVLVQIFDLPVATIGSRFGDISSTLPVPSLPTFNFAVFKQMFRPALSIALLGAIESLLSAVVADGMTGGRHRSNMELVAQGIANIITPLFGGIPATGAIARTATNIKNGARTPVAGMIHAVTLLLIMLFLGRFARLIPLPALAAILMIVSYNMSEWRSFKALFKSPRSDVFVLLQTFILTVVVDLTVAIETGMLLSLFIFMHGMAEASHVRVFRRELQEHEESEMDSFPVSNQQLPKDTEIFEINGAFFFGAAEKFRESLKELGSNPRVRIIQMRHVLTLDATGLHVLENVFHDCHKRRCVLVLSGVHDQPLRVLENSGLLEKFGVENVCSNIDVALKRAARIVGDKNLVLSSNSF